MKRITAKQARKLTEYKEEPTMTLDEIYENILLTTEKGFEKMAFPAILSKVTVLILESDGYILTNKGFMWEIS